MKKVDRDHIDDLFRSKLYDFEVETAPEDWEAIEKRLDRPSIPFYRKHTYQWLAAAAVAVLVVLSFGIPWSKDEDELVKMAMEVKKEAEKQAVKEDWVAAAEENDTVGKHEAVVNKSVTRARLLSVNTRKADDRIADKSSEELIATASADTVETETVREQVAESPVQAKESTAVKKQPVQTRTVVEEQPAQAKAQPKSRKWGFGMGAGSISAGNSSSVNAFALRSSAVTNEYLSLMNATSAFEEVPKTDVKHKMPLSFGLSVSRYLSDRWSLQTGLSYSYLVSEWTTNKTYRAESEQRLHFLGIPVSATYKIAEWNKFLFYASAGGKVELNVAGKVCTDLYSPVEKLKSVTEKERMKEPYFSVNGRVGVSYPIIRFISAYAEVGTDYYFDNGSDVETIHSEKPFYVGLQFGFRFGF